MYFVRVLNVYYIYIYLYIIYIRIYTFINICTTMWYMHVYTIYICCLYRYIFKESTVAGPGTRSQRCRLYPSAICALSASHTPHRTSCRMQRCRGHILLLAWRFGQFQRRIPRPAGRLREQVLHPATEPTAPAGWFPPVDRRMYLFEVLYDMFEY